MANKIDPQADTQDRCQRNWQRLAKGGFTTAISLSSTGGLQFSSSQLAIKLNGSSLLLGASGLSINTAGVTLAMMANLAADTLIGRSTASTGVPEVITCTAAGRALIDDASASAQRTTLGLADLATRAGTRGTATLVAGTVVVNTALVTANSLIWLTGTNGGTTRLGVPHVTARTASTSFTITSIGGVADDYPVSWLILEP